jgi:hypothetical protein
MEWKKNALDGLIQRFICINSIFKNSLYPTPRTKDSSALAPIAAASFFKLIFAQLKKDTANSGKQLL